MDIHIYIDDGRVFSYSVETESSVREHIHAIIQTGYRHCSMEGEFEHYPPHRILKVKSSGITSKYIDTIAGT